MKKKTRTPITRERVLKELERRASRGRSLGSGANRDWLYSAALQVFGSWKKAIEAAGHSYNAIKQRPLTRKEVLAKLKAIAALGKPVLAAHQQPRLATAAIRHFGSWRRAVKAAGGTSGIGRVTWTPARVIDAIRAAERDGLPTNSARVMRRDRNLYMAGRRRFGSWAAALAAAA